MPSYLDTRSKQVFALMTLAGLVTLAASLGSFFASSNWHVFEVRRTYQWEAKGPGTGQTDISYSVDRSCSAPKVATALAAAKTALASYLASQPPATTAATPQYTEEQATLQAAVLAAEDATANLGAQSIRKGEVEEQMNQPNTAATAIGGPGAFNGAPTVPQATPDMTDAAKFDVTLRAALHIYGLPDPVLADIETNCLRQQPVEFVLTSTTASTDLGYWLIYSQPYSSLGIGLTLVGIIGWLAQILAPPPVRERRRGRVGPSAKT